MKRIILGLLLMVGLLVLFSVQAFAGMVEADALSAAGKYVEAEKEFRAILPTLTGNDAFRAQFYLIWFLEWQKKYDEAIVEYQKFKDSAEKPGWVAIYQLHIGYCLEGQRKYSEAQTAYKGVLLIKDVTAAVLLEALKKVDLSEMTVEDRDIYLLKAYNKISDKMERDKDGNLVYEKYLSGLVVEMSLAARATLIK